MATKVWQAAAALAVMSVLAGPVALAPPALAHHSGYEAYDFTSPQQLRGRLVEVDWTNPHVFLHLEDEQTGRIWHFEWHSISRLRRSGLTGADDFTIGDTYVVLYIPLKAGDEPLGLLLNVATALQHDLTQSWGTN